MYQKGYKESIEPGEIDPKLLPDILAFASVFGMG
jgi:hypothetical protein